MKCNKCNSAKTLLVFRLVTVAAIILMVVVFFVARSDTKKIKDKNNKTSERLRKLNLELRLQEEQIILLRRTK